GRHLDLAVDGVADPHRRQHLLLQLEHGEPRSLDHALAEEPLDQAVGQGGRHELSLDRTALLSAEGAVREDGLEHPGHAGEQHEVGLGDGAIERAKALSSRELLPGESEAERLHAIPPDPRASLGRAPLRQRPSIRATSLSFRRGWIPARPLSTARARRDPTWPRSTPAPAPASGCRPGWPPPTQCY